MIKKILKKVFKPIQQNKSNNSELINDFLTNGMIPWSRGYREYKNSNINASIIDDEFLKEFKKENLPLDYGHRIDERIVEYSWIFSNLSKKEESVLDAGSTFNFDFIVNHPKIKNKDLTIFTYSPEKDCFFDKGISYNFGDLRDIPFKDELFDTIVSQSTIEHIDMDNSIYGYDINHNEDNTKKSYSYLVAVEEMLRVLKSKGKLLLTFPYGKFEHHGFFQQFDLEMLNRILELFKHKGQYTNTFFLYTDAGWRIAKQKELANTISFNPHTGKGKLDDTAAHCRSVVCIKFIKA